MNELVPLLKFTPSALDPTILEEITVQREPLIATLVESALDIQSGLRHHLLVGPRGIGKTHVLSLVATRLRKIDPACGFAVVAWLHEDPWAIRGYNKFLAAILARVAETTADADLARSATALRSNGAATDGLEGEALLRSAVGDRRLVLLVENLDEVFRRIGPDGQSRFRAFAEDWQQLLILASTPQLFAGVQRHASPFYGFFAVTHLDELSLTSATELLKRIASLHGDEALLRYLDTDTAAHRLTAVEALAGGHPRIWLLLAGCISIAGIDELVPLFLEALDDLTPYYQDRLHELSDQQQELVVLLGEAGGALSNRELSERSGISQAQVAKLLSQLADRGYVRHATLPDDLAAGDKRMTFWELREPLMRLCLDVKQARGEPLRLVVEFLRAWYGPKLLDELDRLPAVATLAMTYAIEAFRTLDIDGPEFEDLLRGTPDEVLARLERGMSIRPQDTALQFARVIGLLMSGREEEALAAFERLAGGDPTTSSYHFVHAWLLRTLGRFDAADEAAWRGIELDEQNPVCRMAVVEIALARGDAAGAVSLLREALAVWDRGSATSPGDTALLCLSLWYQLRSDTRRCEIIAQVISAFDEADAIEYLGRGVVHSIQAFAETDVSQQDTDAWVQDWERASTSPDLEIPLNILRAACEWKRDGDRAHLLALPPEQRDILVGLLRLADRAPHPLPAVNIPGSNDFTPDSAA